MTAVLGIALCAAALLACLMLVAAPAGPRIPASRRRAPGVVPPSGLSRLAEALVAGIGRIMGNPQGETSLARTLELAGLTIAPPAFVLLVLCAAVVLGLIGVALGGFSLLSVPAAVVLGVLAPIGAAVLLTVRRNRRRAAFADQLDDTLSLLTGSLRAGHSLLRAIDGVADEVDSPMREEFTRVVNETRLGRSAGAALTQTADRMQSEDLRWVAQAVSITQDAGGNLSEVLAQVGRTIRERSEIRRQVHALSAEGRLSALILMLLPVAVVLLLLVIRPGYLAPLFGELLGWLALGAAVVLMIVGGLWMRVAVRVRF